VHRLLSLLSGVFIESLHLLLSSLSGLLVESSRCIGASVHRCVGASASFLAVKGCSSSRCIGASVHPVIVEQHRHHVCPFLVTEKTQSKFLVVNR
jgi:hypothetical protein